MRPIVAVMLLGFSLLPRIASAKKKPPEIIPALAKAKVIGVHCAEGSGIVGLATCQAFIDEIRQQLSPHFRVVKVIDALTSSGELTESSPEPYDIYVYLWTDRSGDLNRYGSTVTDERGGRKIADFSGGNVCLSWSGDELAAASKCVYDFIFLHSGQAAEACRNPQAYWRVSFRSPEGQKASKHFEEFCKKHGLP